MKKILINYYNKNTIGKFSLIHDKRNHLKFRQYNNKNLLHK